MKKLLCFILCTLLCIPLSGCNNKSSEVTAVTSGLKFTAHTTYLEENYEYHITVTENGEMLTEVFDKEKNTILTAHFSDENVTLRYSDLEYKTEISALPQGLIIDFFYSVFCDTATKKDNVLFQNDQYLISGSTDKYKYKMFLGQTGIPIKITEENLSITAVLKNQALL